MSANAVIGAKDSLGRTTTEKSRTIYIGGMKGADAWSSFSPETDGGRMYTVKSGAGDIGGNNHQKRPTRPDNGAGAAL